jgi:hypothetical protein
MQMRRDTTPKFINIWIPVTLAVLTSLLGCTKEFWDGVSHGIQEGQREQREAYIARTGGNNQGKEDRPVSRDDYPAESQLKSTQNNPKATQLSQASKSKLKELTSEIVQLLDEYGGGDLSQQGRFEECTFFFEQGEEKFKVWKYTIPLGVLHYQSLRNYRPRVDRTYYVPAVLLKTAKGKAAIKSVFLQWKFGILDSPLETQVPNVEVLFSDAEIASAAAIAFARAVEICADK